MEFMIDKLVSIILPVYNVEKYIVKCIQSILRQSYSNFELLIVNDGTLDKSIEIAGQFKDSRIKIFNKENGGLSDARNYGLEKVSGEYIYFMDSDDWIEPELLTICIDAIESYNSDFIIFGYYLDRESIDGHLISTNKMNHQEFVFSKKRNDLYFETNTLGLMGYAWNKLYKTSFLKENNLQFEKGVSLVEDILFNSRVFEISNEIVFIDKVLYHYIDRTLISLMKSFHENSFELNVRKNRAVNCFLKEWNVDTNLKNEVLADSIVTGIRYCVNNLFAYQDNLNFKKIYNYLKTMVNHEETVKYITYYKPTTLNERVYKVLIDTKSVLTIYLLFKIIK
tara:strand:+ start:3919 stop:4932 length:1014 start_codon:yes stop_codon:yes gene_type:complete